jgi:hypothetical protein
MATAAGLALLLYLAWSFSSNCVVRGKEFSPDLFQERQFSYYRIPGTSIRLSATSLTPAVSPNTKHVLGVMPATPASITWHVVEASQGAVSETHGPMILLHYLNSKNADGHSYWDEWSFRNPSLAKALWPIVQQAAKQDLYICIPELMRLAEKEQNALLLKKELTRTCLKAAQHRSKAKSNANTPAALPYRDWAETFATEFMNDQDIATMVQSFL